MFEQEINRALAYAAQGLSVGIVGGAGSGRTSMANRLTTGLVEHLGFDVLSVSPGRPLAVVPYTGILSLDLDASLELETRSVSEVLSVQAGACVIDDGESLDHETLGVIDLLRKRTGLPIIMTLSDSPFHRTHKLFSWPQATVHLSPLRYSQISDLIASTLGHPADAELVASVLIATGGNLRLADHMIRTAAHSARIHLHHGYWHMRGPDLFNEHMHPAVACSLRDLDPEEAKALSTLSILGPGPVENLIGLVGADVLDRLELRRLIAVQADDHGELHASVFPPVVADYLKKNVLSSRRIFKNTIDQHRFNAFASGTAQLLNSSADDSPLTALKTEMTGNHIATAWIFRQELESLESRRFMAWDANRSLSNAVAYLRLHWGSSAGQDRVAEVLGGTSLEEGDPGNLLFFTMSRALFTLMNGGNLSACREIMNQLVESVPGTEAGARAFTTLLESSYCGLPEDLDNVLLRLDEHSPGVAEIKGLLELCRFDPEAALRAIDPLKGGEGLLRVEPLIRSMALYSTGRIAEALAYSLRGREDAIESGDQFALVIHSYVAVLALTHSGLLDEAEYLDDWIHSVQKPGLFIEPLHNAMPQLARLRRAPGSPTPSDRENTCLPGPGTGFFDLAVRRIDSPGEFDESACCLIDMQLAKGFVLAAVHVGLFFLCRSPGPLVNARLQKILRSHRTTHHDQLLAIADAVLDGDLKRLDHLVEHYRQDDDNYLTATLLRGGAKRYRSAGESKVAQAIERAAETFRSKFLPNNQSMLFEPDGSEPPLSDREAGIALLAGYKSNPEIASRLGLSVRTVENHVAAALRKTGTMTRKSLSEHMRHAQRWTLST